jgi:hypothetical protein
VWPSDGLQPGRLRPKRWHAGSQPRAFWTLTLLTLVLAQGGAAYATSLSLTDAGVSAGSGSVFACDADGFAFRHTVNGSAEITSVTVAGIAAACAGGQLRLTLANGQTSLAGASAALPASGFSGSASVSVAATQSNLVTRVLAAIEGP